MFHRIEEGIGISAWIIMLSVQATIDLTTKRKVFDIGHQLCIQNRKGSRPSLDEFKHSGTHSVSFCAHSD